MKETLKVLINHFLIITVGVLFFTSLLDLILGNTVIKVEFQFQIIFTGFICALPTLLFYFRNEPTKKQFFIRVLIHFILITAIVMIVGKYFCWYSDVIEGLLVFAIVVGVYLLAWRYTIFMNMNEAKKINEALANFNKEND